MDVSPNFYLHFLYAGLKTALVELDDFASGTSSRSTKLIHGGVRYLQKAIMGVGQKILKIFYSNDAICRNAILFFFHSSTLSSIAW